MKSTDLIKKEALKINTSLEKTLQVYHLDLEDVGVFYFDNNILSIEKIDSKAYPVSIFYNIKKDEIHQLKVDFTHEKIKNAVIIERQKNCHFAS